MERKADEHGGGKPLGSSHGAGSRAMIHGLRFIRFRWLVCTCTQRGCIATPCSHLPTPTSSAHLVIVSLHIPRHDVKLRHPIHTLLSSSLPHLCLRIVSSCHCVIVSSCHRVIVSYHILRHDANIFSMHTVPGSRWCRCPPLSARRPPPPAAPDHASGKRGRGSDGMHRACVSVLYAYTGGRVAWYKVR